VVEKSIICLGSAVWDTIFQVESIPTAGIKVLPSRALQIASGMATSAAITMRGLVETPSSGRVWVMTISPGGLFRMCRVKALIPGVCACSWA
jgi:sulfofructose kinase